MSCPHANNPAVFSKIHTLAIGASTDKKGNNARGNSHKYTDLKAQYFASLWVDMYCQHFFNCRGNATLGDMECAMMAAAEAAGFRTHNLNGGGSNVDVRLRPGHTIYVMVFKGCTKMRVRGESDINHNKRLTKTTLRHLGLDAWTQRTDKVSRGVDKKTLGTDKVSRGVDKYTRGVDKFSLGTDKVSRGLDKVSRGLDKKTLGTDKVARGVDKKTLGTDKLTRGVDKKTLGTDKVARGVDKVSLGNGLRGNGQDKYTLGTHKKSKKKPFIRSTLQWLAAWTLAQSQPGKAAFTRTEIDGNRMPQSQRKPVRLLEAQLAKAAPLFR